jgi:thioredoxin 1
MSIRTWGTYTLFVITIFLCVCSSKKDPANNPPAEQAAILKEIGSAQQFDTLVSGAGNKLLVFDFYADWCMPCRILSPTLESIGKEFENKVFFYKINIDRNNDLAARYSVKGIPTILFLKNQQEITRFVGVRVAEEYVSIIQQNL